MSFKYRIVITEHAKNDLHSLEKDIASRIIKKLRYFESNENPLKYAEPLKAPFQGKYRFRIGEYRVIFILEPYGRITILFVLNIRHRRDVYK